MSQQKNNQFLLPKQLQGTSVYSTETGKFLGICVPVECEPGKHNFQPNSAHPGHHCILCTKCTLEKPGKLLQPSVYSFKGRNFAFKPGHKFHPPRQYEC